MIRRIIAFTGIIFALALLATGPAYAQNIEGREEYPVDVPSYDGITANAPVPASMHLRNEGSPVDGAGECVISSVVVNGQYQHIPGFDTPGKGTSNIPGEYGVIPNAPGKGSPLWLAALERPGGYYPQKLEALVAEACPEVKWANYVGTNTGKLEEWSAMGYPIGATMNTGGNYHWQPIAHMITLASYRQGGWACVVDNNFPGEYLWMLATEFDRRWISNGEGWAWIWTELSSTAGSADDDTILLLLLVGAGLVFVVIAKRRRDTEMEVAFHA